MAIRKYWQQALVLCLPIIVLFAVNNAISAPMNAAVGDGCFNTAELIGGQGFNAAGLGFNAAGLGFNVSGLGFNAAGLGFNAAGLEDLIAEITDPANRIDPATLTDLLPGFVDDIAPGLGFGDYQVALVIVDDFGDGDLTGDPDPADPHGKKVADVAKSVISSLETLGTIPAGTILIEPVNINGGAEPYNVESLVPRLSSAVNNLIGQGITHIVINLSVAIWPCDATINLSDGTVVDFNFNEILNEIQSVPDDDPTQVTNFLECVSDYGDDRLIAHFGYENLNGSPIVIPPGDNNALAGGGYDDGAILEALTPFYFGRPNVVEEQPGRSAPFPNTAFQVPFDPDFPLTWTLNGNTVTASNMSNRCLVPEGYGFMQYFKEVLGLSDNLVAELLLELGELGSDADLLANLQSLLAGYLAQSRDDTNDIAVIPVAASGNSAYLFPEGTDAPPFSPARMIETIATSALLGGQSNAQLWQFSQDGNIAVPGGAFELDPISAPGSLYIGTSFAAPFNSVIAALWLTYPDACTFEDNGRPPLNLPFAADYLNVTYPLGAGEYPLNCARQVVTNVAIDIKPGNDQNTFNPGSEGTLTVAILGSEAFDVNFVNATTVRLLGAPVRTIGQNKLDVQFKDVNSDGFPDMVLQFNTSEMNLVPGMTEVELTGELLDGVTLISGVDMLDVVPSQSQTATLLSLPNGATSVFATPTLTWMPACGWLLLPDRD